jgi:hypothetical protein
MSQVRACLTLATAAVVFASVALGLEPDVRLLQPVVVWAPDCEQPAAYYSEDWSPRALGFYVIYRDGTVNAPQLTKQLAQRHGFVVLEAGTSGFTARWLEPRQVALLRCVREVKAIDFVLPVAQAGT